MSEPQCHCCRLSLGLTDLPSDLADKYGTKQSQRDLSAKIINYLLQERDFIGADWLKDGDDTRDVRLLDYACGTGMVSKVPPYIPCSHRVAILKHFQALAPYVTSCHGLDLSSNMVTRYNDLVSSFSSPPHTAHAQVGDLLTEAEPPPSLNGPEFHGFSIAAIGLGFHHFNDPSLALHRLAQRLKPGGVLLIIDFVEEQGVKMPSVADHTIHRHGYEENEMKHFFEGGGLLDFGWTVMPERVELELNEDSPISRKVFLARGRKVD